MNKMEKEFVPYEQVSSLIALGFNEPVIAHRQDGLDICLLKQPEVLLTDLSMILYQQAFRWFREKYNLRGFIGFRPNVKMFDYHIYDMSLSGLEYTKQRTMEEFNKDPKVGTYEEAELECLKKLIEIVESKSE